MGPLAHKYPPHFYATPNIIWSIQNDIDRHILHQMGIDIHKNKFDDLLFVKKFQKDLKQFCIEQGPPLGFWNNFFHFNDNKINSYFDYLTDVDRTNVGLYVNEDPDGKTRICVRFFDKIEYIIHYDKQLICREVSPKIIK